jgi:hypothetical protein
MTAGVTRYAKSGDVHIAYRVEGCRMRSASTAAGRRNLRFAQ